MRLIAGHERTLRHRFFDGDVPLQHAGVPGFRTNAIEKRPALLQGERPRRSHDLGRPLQTGDRVQIFINLRYGSAGRKNRARCKDVYRADGIPPFVPARVEANQALTTHKDAGREISLLASHREDDGAEHSVVLSSDRVSPSKEG